MIGDGDQANRLRNLMLSKQAGPKGDKESRSGLASPRVIVISSGRSGVGKSNLVLNLAIQFVKQGRRVTVVDADFSHTNIGALIGLGGQNNFLEVLEGDKEIGDALAIGPGGFNFLSAGQGFVKLADRQNRQISRLDEKVAPLDYISDIILVDTGVGMANRVVDFIASSNEAILMITPEAASITDAYAVIKRVKEQNEAMPELYVVANRAESKAGGDEIFAKLERACNKFLEIQLINIGYLPHDPNLTKAVKARQPVSIMYPDSPIVKSIELIGEQLISGDRVVSDLGFKAFMQKIDKKFNNN